ncbi:MAG: hypothetical protein ACLPQ6_01680 [Steroidobacteraceae bacterium]|jgi:hypothetical protein
MRFAAGLLALAGAVNLALAEEPPAAPASVPAAPAASAPAAAATPAAAAAIPASAAQSSTTAAAATKPAVDKDIQHFMQEGFKPQMRRGQEIYCRKELAIGSRLAPQSTCGTIEELKLMERQTRSDMEQAQQRQSSGPSSR